MKSEKLMIALGFALVSLIWGSTWLAIKIGLESVPPLFAVAIRFTLATIILFVIMKARRERLPMHRRAISLYVAVALLTYSFPFALVYWGEQYIPSGLASILFAVYPFVVAIGSHFFIEGERMNVLKMSGILLGFAGVTMIFWSDLQAGGASGWGMIGILASTLMQGASLIVLKRMGKEISTTSITLGGMTFGIVILYFLAFLFEDFRQIHFDAKGIGSIVYLGTFGSVVTFLTYYWLLRRVQAVYLSLVTLVTPLLAVILGAIVLGETLEPNVFTGATAICAGILVANGRDILSALHQQKSRIFSGNS
jgi:drug/metabolite transporter (DMT)-like permease